METTSTSASLGDGAYQLNYVNNRVVQINIENLLFLTFIKLRRYTTNYEYILIYWITLTSRQLKESDVWPHRT